MIIKGRGREDAFRECGVACRGEGEPHHGRRDDDDGDGFCAGE